MASNPSAPPEVSNDALSGTTKAEMSTAQPGVQPPPYTVQQNVAAPYPTEPAMAKYPTPMDPQPQPGGYPQPQTVAYHVPQPGMAAPTSGNAVVITQPGVGTTGHVIVAQTDIYPSSVGAIVFSCIVAWLCCCVFGLAAFIVASKFTFFRMLFPYNN